jgi:hypothetical protein
MVVNLFENRTAEESSNFLAHPISPGIRIFTGEVRALDVLSPQVTVHIDHAGIDIHAVFRSSFLQKPGRDFVS